MSKFQANIVLKVCIWGDTQLLSNQTPELINCDDHLKIGWLNKVRVADAHPKINEFC